MSVIRSKRNESKMDFIYNARQLHIYAVKKCIGFPKRYTFFVSVPLASSARKVHSYVKKANSIYPTNSDESQLRINQLLLANAELNDMVSQIEVAGELFDLEDRVMKLWMDLVNKEISLVKGVIKTDRAVQKKLKEKETVELINRIKKVQQDFKLTPEMLNQWLVVFEKGATILKALSG